MTPTLLELPKRTLADSANVLRAIADEIEANKYGEVKAGIVVLEADTIETFGMVGADFYRAFSLLRRAENKLLEDA